jgi:elongation factor G
LQIPIGIEEHFKGVVDLITMKALIWSNEAKGANYETSIFLLTCGSAKAQREKFVEAVSAIDDDLMMKYLEGEEISEDEIRAALRKGTLAMKIVPVVTGSAFKNKGCADIA